MSEGLRAQIVAALAVVSGSALAVATQVDLREEHQRIDFGTDAYLLPPPSHLERMSLGYRAALADILWADLLVSQGLRLGERRRYDLVIESLDAVTYLDPSWRDPYRMAQPLVTMQAAITPTEQVIALRALLERGMREHPTDAELHLIAGAWIGTTAPNSYFENDPVTAEAWRRAGAEQLARAAELAPSDTTIVWQALAGDRQLLRSGEYERAMEMYVTILATTEDPELRDKIEERIATLERQKKAGAALIAEKQRDARAAAYAEMAAQSYPALPPRYLRLLPYPRRQDACAGGARAEAFETLACAQSWSDFARIDPWGGVTPLAPAPPK